MSDLSFSIFDAAVSSGLPRDTSRPVILVGFLAQGNLGLGYLASQLRAHGYRVEIIDFETDADLVLHAARALNPMVIGFSLIFQYYIDRFRELMLTLRNDGIDCHFTVGGHFPSLSYENALNELPEADSVVRFEGEMTLLELVDRIGSRREWRDLQGIAFRRSDQVVATALRPLVENLDQLPYPDRSMGLDGMMGHKIAPILASRGCARTCSFCSIHMFYRAAPGKVVRTRKPAQVVREMRHLYDTKNASIFLFQDDDFPLFGPAWKRWTREFLGELHRIGLVGKVIWKISCRADAVDPELFAEMRDAGLHLVYMGLESGTEEGLKTLHKQITAEQNLRAVEILKSLNIPFQFGFMLFEPSSTFESVRENLKFLRAIVDDGCLAVTFCRMIPYDGTPIKETLLRDGRLKGDVRNPGYDFLDPRLDQFYYTLTQVVDLTGWVHGYKSLSPQINLAWSELAVLERMFPALSDTEDYKRWLRKLTQASNDVLFRVVEDTARTFEHGGENPWSKEILEQESERFLKELLTTRDAFVLRHQNELLSVLNITRAA